MISMSNKSEPQTTTTHYKSPWTNCGMKVFASLSKLWDTSNCWTAELY